MGRLRASSKLSTFELVLGSTSANAEFFKVCAVLAKDAKNECESVTQADTDSETEPNEVLLFKRKLK